MPCWQARCHVRDGKISITCNYIITMKKFFIFTIALIGCLALQAQVRADVGDNKLSKEEVRDGWHLLFDGQTTTGWRSAKAQTFPKGGWEVANGILRVLPGDGQESANGGDIVTTREGRFHDYPGCQQRH